MACLVTKGRAINCNDVQGGISALFITNGVAPYGTVTISSDAISNMSGTFTAFKYDLNGAGNSFTLILPSEPGFFSKSNGSR